MDEYKHSEEWVALNDIWRSISKEQREANYDNFKIVTEFIKASYSNKNLLAEEKSEETCVDDYRYLDKVSESAKNLVIDLVNKGEKKYISQHYVNNCHKPRRIQIRGPTMGILFQTLWQRATIHLCARE